MKLSKLYSNDAKAFPPVAFASGLNVVLAEIRLPENREKDTHNLGKSTLGRMLDFCFLSSRDSKFFLFKYPDLFEKFVFFLEIEIGTAQFLTVRRAVENASRISFKKHSAPDQDFSELSQRDWDHFEVPFERSQELLDSFLNWEAVKPWTYRKGLGYLLRTQDDFRDVFHLRKFAGGHAEWKPFVARLLGFDAKLVQDLYSVEDQLAGKEHAEGTIEKELRGSVHDLSKIEGLLLLKEQDAKKAERLLSTFDFRVPDRVDTKQLVDGLDSRIAELNGRRYTLATAKRKIETALQEDQILFKPQEAQELFAEAGVLFAGQIKADFEQLIAFNRALSDERRTYLLEELKEGNAELDAINSELSDLGKRRSEVLSSLTAGDAFQRYRDLSDALANLRADIISLQAQRQHLSSLQKLRDEIRALKEQRTELQVHLEKDVEQQNRAHDSLFSDVRINFSEIVEVVIDRKALLSVTTNTLGHVEFKAEILDESGKSTSADDGHTYRKLLCIAFDLAILRSWLGQRFPRFVFHDGVFESLDDRKKANLLAVLRDYANLGLQPIITLIDSDLPPMSSPPNFPFEGSEIVLRLHDEGPSGRLFKMRTW